MNAVGTAVKYGPAAYKVYKMATAPPVVAAATRIPVTAPAIAAMPVPAAAVPPVSRPAPKVRLIPGIIAMKEHI